MEHANPPRESRKKRDFLRSLEKDMQHTWHNSQVFCSNPKQGKPKYLATFPYPYMNGRLHLGHTFTLTKAEFAASYMSMKGFNVLFPFAFHCTGMPIKACADKLKVELEQDQPTMPDTNPKAETPDSAPTSSGKVDPLAFHAQKSKAKAKSSAMSQSDILLSMGIPPSEIPKFADASHWVSYFPEKCMEDIQTLGCRIDWRRSFITTNLNPYYDSFVQWQFEKLKEGGKIKFGKRYTVFSAKDGGPCADHDRQTGEGVVPQEYVAVLQKLLDVPETLKPWAKKNIYLLPSTLRPETMYGQTNCWILPEGNYGLFEISDDWLFVCTERAAKNLAFQTYSKEAGKVVKLADIKGRELIGCALSAPLTKYEKIYVLPMETISESKGTGIVTSVPSDSPDDYINFQMLKNKPEYRASYGIQDHMILPFEIVPVIQIPELGPCAAEDMCKKYSIKSPKDRELLDMAKEFTYQKGFYEGVMVIGPEKGTPVKDAKNKIKEQLFNAKQAIPYAEPAETVISRSGDVCIVALTDQWFIDYGEKSWKESVEKCLPNLNTFSPETKQGLIGALNWMNQWACSRVYGLGTRLPWDEKYLIDSLSDSTIYMSFYAVAHLLQGNVFGTQTGPAQIKPEQLNTKVWDYIFRKQEYPKDCTIPEETLQKLRAEFEYWYPVDLRVSGKDLVPNHLLFYLYNHTAIWGPEMFPKGIRANGHVLLNSEKMSKSTGNFLTLVDAVNEYTADGCRIALADAGDTLDDANFSTKGADSAVVKLYNFIQWACSLKNDTTMKKGKATTWAERVFLSQINHAINEADAHYAKTNYREALKSGFFDLMRARDRYLGMCGQPNQDLLKYYIKVQALIISPIAPHFAEYIWQIVLGNTTSIRTESWPVAGEIDQVLMQQSDYLQDIAHEFRLKVEGEKRKHPSKKLVSASILVGAEYPSWMQKVAQISMELKGDDAALRSAIQLAVDAALREKALAFAETIKSNAKQGNYQLQSPFDEKAFLQENLVVLSQLLDGMKLDVQVVDGVVPMTPKLRFSSAQ